MSKYFNIIIIIINYKIHFNSINLKIKLINKKKMLLKKKEEKILLYRVIAMTSLEKMLSILLEYVEGF